MSITIGTATAVIVAVTAIKILLDIIRFLRDFHNFKIDCNYNFTTGIPATFGANLPLKICAATRAFSNPGHFAPTLSANSTAPQLRPLYLALPALPFLWHPAVWI
jgi:hypothetical protein